MNSVLLLDSGPLGLLTAARRAAPVLDILAWSSACEEAGHRILVPAIIDYELRRELLRAGKDDGVRRLDEFIAAAPNRYLPLTDDALHAAANLWAHARRQGRPTASNPALDIDVILAAQALSLTSPDPIIVVTNNPRHLQPFCDARLWTDIQP